MKFCDLGKKDQLDRLNIFQGFYSEICAYLNAEKPLFQNTLQESTFSRVPSTVEISTSALLS